jgi:amino acid permease
MDFNQLKEVWEKAEHLTSNVSDIELDKKLKAVTITQQKVMQYFRFEMVIAVAAILLFGVVAYLKDDLEPYFYKLFVLVLIGSVPLNIRLFFSMKRILSIDYTNPLRENIISAKNYFRTTIRTYYVIVAFTVISLVLISWWDDYFLQLPFAWQVGVMSYLLLYLVVSIYVINKLYGKRLKVLEEFLKDL